MLPTLATKADLAEVRADMQRISSDVSRWTLQTVITIIGTMVVGIGGLMFTVSRQPAPAPQQPTVIVVPALQAPAPAGSR